ncbi:MAG: glycosyltransferase [Desulfosarcina sp.]|nr:glycosyltransferase [Desulfosarcina sp.]MBC2742458.1 glycosyltransferase [Desulfosarcina sp.]MBC2765368.1 glycosyltransferase family 4 protein [Desulfosarcina sp.]
MVYFHPFSSQLGLLESLMCRPKRADLLFVPCFRHRDISSAAFWARKWHVPLVLDPLISAYEKEVFEREKWPPDSPGAEHRRKWESRLFAEGDVVIADTAAHAHFFQDRLNVRPENLHVLYVSAEQPLFSEKPPPKPDPPFELLFYGSFLELHGIDVIINAAKQFNTPDVHWVLLGEGDIKQKMQIEARDYPNIRFESWIPYESLPDRIARAHIMLGVFGPTVLTDLVIPNKMFQSMAVGRPVITSISPAYNDSLEGFETIGWVPGGDPMALADMVRTWLNAPHQLEKRGRETRKLFDHYFSITSLKSALKTIIKTAFANAGYDQTAP